MLTARDINSVFHPIRPATVPTAIIDGNGVTSKFVGVAQLDPYEMTLRCVISAITRDKRSLGINYYLQDATSKILAEDLQKLDEGDHPFRRYLGESADRTNPLRVVFSISDIINDPMEEKTPRKVICMFFRPDDFCKIYLDVERKNNNLLDGEAEHAEGVTLNQFISYLGGIDHWRDLDFKVVLGECVTPKANLTFEN